MKPENHHKRQNNYVPKSCTTKDDDYPIIYTVLTIPGGAGFRLSTVCSNSLLKIQFLQRFTWAMKKNMVV